MGLTAQLRYRIETTLASECDAEWRSERNTLTNYVTTFGKAAFAEYKERFSMIWLSASHKAQSPRIWDACGKLPPVNFRNHPRHRPRDIPCDFARRDDVSRLSQCTPLLDGIAYTHGKKGPPPSTRTPSQSIECLSRRICRFVPWSCERVKNSVHCGNLDEALKISLRTVR
jgi:hypothetical protein